MTTLERRTHDEAGNEYGKLDTSKPHPSKLPMTTQKGGAKQFKDSVREQARKLERASKSVEATEPGEPQK